MSYPWKALAAAAVSVVLAGCGVAAQATPQPIQPPAGALGSLAAPPGATDSGRTPEDLYFVKDNAVIRVVRHVRAPVTIESVVRDLLAGPSDAESADGYTSALLGDSVVDSVDVNAGQAVVALTSPVADSARNDEVLAYAQLVCTLTTLPQIGGVTFTTDGAPVAVPRGDGSLQPKVAGQLVPLTAADYTELVGR